MYLKKILLIGLLPFTFVQCESSFSKNEDGTFTKEERLNDSIIRRVHLDQNRKKSSEERENTKRKIVKVYYYDSKGNLSQTLEFSTVNAKLYENHIYDNDKLFQKILKDDEGKLLSVIEYDSEGRLFEKRYYRKGQTNINAFVFYDKNGKAENSEGHASFLEIRKRNNELFIKPIGLPDTEYQEASISILKNFRKYPDSSPVIKKEFQYSKGSQLRLPLSEIDSKELKCEVKVLIGEVDGYPLSKVYELYIKDLNNCPVNNLYPIIVD